MNKKRWSGVLWIIILSALSAMIFSSCNNPPELTNDETALETPYCTLQYPEEWKDYLTVEQKQEKPLIIAYYAQLENKEAQHLFDIGFDSQKGIYVGSLDTTNGNKVKVYIELGVLTMDDSWSDADKQIVIGMYDDLSYLLENMTLSIENETLQEEEIAPAKEEAEAIAYQDMIVNTPYGDLYYPGEWADRIVVTTHQNEGYEVSYSAMAGDEQDYPLFDVCFTEDVVDVLGVVELSDGRIMGVKIVFYPLDEVPEDQREQFAVMQEAANHIIGNMTLKKLPEPIEEEYQPTGEPEEPEVQYSDIEIDTPYAKLTYSGKWANQMRAQRAEGEVFTLKFYGKINSKPEVYLFALSLGVADDEAAIVIDGTQGRLGIGIAMNEMVFDDTWSEDEKNTIYAMREEVNYIIENIVFIDS